MKDFLGVEILLGDTVVSYDPRYKQLHQFTVEKFTPKMVRLRWSANNTTVRLAAECIVVLAKREITI